MPASSRKKNKKTGPPRSGRRAKAPKEGGKKEPSGDFYTNSQLEFVFNTDDSWESRDGF